jgi:N-acetylmuramoyl-L-alanine amidase
VKHRIHFLPIVFAIVALVATAAYDKRLTVYTPETSYSVVVVDRDGREYVPLLDVLTRLGNARANPDGDKWKLRFNDTESEFKVGKTKGKVNRKDVQMPAPFVLVNGQGLVPVQSLGPVLSRLIPSKLEFRESARRVFIGGATTQFTAELQTTAPPKLVLRFSAPVNPSIATEPGKLRMVFTREPLIANTPAQTFDDKIIKGASFAEHDGLAELTIHSGAPLQATFGEQNRTITIAPVQPAQAQAAPAPEPAPSATGPGGLPAQPAPAAPGTAAPVAHPRATVVIDPGHGGDDRGAALSERLVEKDVTLAWARRLRAALEQKGITAMLLRDGDISLSPDQRAALANAARPQVFVSLHAGSTGSGVRIYTAHLGETAARVGSFLPWDSAQAAFLDASRALAGSVAAEMHKHEIPAGTAPVLVRPLNNIAAPAVAIEVMPPTADIGGLMATGYQQSVCAAIADGIAAAGKTGATGGSR